MSLFFVVSLCGCSLLKVQTETAPDLAPLHRPAEALLELERQADDFAVKATGLVYQQGAEAKAPLVGQMVKVIEARRIRTGLPAKPLRAPENVSGSDRAATALIAQLQRRNEAHRAAEVKWTTEYEQTRGTPVKSSWSLGVLSWLGSTTGILIIAAVILCPSLLKLAAFLVGRYRATRRALEEVVGGVAGVLGATDAATQRSSHLNGREVREILSDHRGPETRAEIRRAKIRLGLPVNPKEIGT